MTEDAWPDGAPEDAEAGVRALNPHRGGFTLTFAGLFAMVLGALAFFRGQMIEPFDMSRYVWREVAGVALGLSLPLFLLGITHSLPGRAWARALAWTGLFCTAVGVAAFAWFYPYFWNVAGRDNSTWGIVPYGVGVVLLGASGFMGLLDSYLERRAARHGGPAYAAGAAAVAAEAPVTEAEIMRDIEEQTRRQRLSWGGMMVDDGPSITLAAGPEIQLEASAAVGRKFTLDNQPTDSEVQRLQSFRGPKGQFREEQESQADALIRLRAARGGAKAHQVAVKKEIRRSWWARLWSR